MSAEMLCGCGEVQGTTNDAKTKAIQKASTEIMKVPKGYLNSVQDILAGIWDDSKTTALKEAEEEWGKRFGTADMDHSDFNYFWKRLRGER